ncbi:MAG: MBOAT family protein [Faecalibacterium sp.]|nr:MBOAT family protein [Ruminococcus sp.]MCM1392192.1 MBOAT family protein [Ruminococcus sp.]MCM1485398.1 MBOAT family protein [Faecalibacterium sp.]
MLFSSMTFLFVFLPLVMILYFIPVFESPKKELNKKNLILCLSSLIFYAWGEPVYIVLMLISIFFNYNIGLDMDNNEWKPKKKKAILVFAVIFNLLVLGFFKYYGFVVDNINNIFDANITHTNLALPVGISFYTFQALSYVIDVYRGDVQPQRKLLPFALYITMFPQLIAGPIVQYSDIETQLESRNINVRKFAVGILFFIRGLGKKVLFANLIGAVYTQITTSANVSELSVVTAWVGILCYTMQIYFDFSGYSDMAIGLGRMFGFNFIQNFNFPYTAKSIKDFWSRWHISLSHWFRDYVYIPLGGNRKGTARTIFNTAVVWTLTGLWHGASWNFVIWGAYYGILLIIEKFVLKDKIEKIPGWLRHVLTMIIVMIGWVFFSSENLSAAWQYLMSMFALNHNTFFDSGAQYYLSTSVFPLILMSASAFGLIKSIPKFKKPSLRLGVQSVGYIIIFVACIIFLISDTYNPFLYFRF